MMPPMLRPAAALLTLLACVGCIEQRAEVQPTAEEQVLLSRLARDPFMVIEGWERDGDQRLVVTTGQGRERVRYVFKPAQIDDKTLTIHRIDDRSVLEVGESDRLGTGPRHR